MPGRTYRDTTYRFGFNNKEKDDETYGQGNEYDYGFRIYNSRLGRFLSVDPLVKSYPWFSPYHFAGNQPIWAIDLDGKEQIYVTSCWYGRTQYTTIQTTVQNVNRANDVGGVTHGYELVTGEFKDKEHRVQYTSISKDGRATITYSENLSKKESTLLAKQFERSDDGKSLADKQYCADFSYTPPTPPPPPKKEVQPAAPIETKVELEIKFQNNKAEFEDAAAAEKILTPVLEDLKANANNKIELHPNTAYARGTTIIGPYTSNMLVQGRGETVTKWLTDRGVDYSQIKITVNDSNFGKALNITGTLTKYDTKPETNSKQK